MIANTILFIPRRRQQDDVPFRRLQQGWHTEAGVWMRICTGQKRWRACNLVVSHSILSAHHRRPLWASEIPWLLLLPHPLKIIASSCLKIQAATAWNNFSVSLSTLICLSLPSQLPEYPISQNSRQCLKCAKLLSFHLYFDSVPLSSPKWGVIFFIFILSHINHTFLLCGVSWFSYSNQE